MTDDPPSNGGYGDTQSLTQGKPMYTVEGNRVGVHDSPRGVMRFEMVRGKMTPKEAKAIQKNLNEAQKRFNQIGPPPRSEEHTSELKSLMRISYAVFC